jgi:hypothetical protein
MEHIDRQKIHRCEHEKKIHKLSHHEQQDLIATPWQIWEKEETNEYIEPEYAYDEIEEDTEEREEEQVWIKRGVIIKEQERQAARFGKGTVVENGKDVMERADDTRKKRRQMIIDNEEAVQAHKEEQHRQGFRYYTNAEQSGNERYINVKYQGGPDLQVSTVRQQLNDIRNLCGEPIQTHLQSIYAKITAQEQKIPETKKEQVQTPRQTNKNHI